LTTPASRPGGRAIGVAFIAAASKIGGANRVLMDLVTGLDRSRYRPLIVAPGPGALPDWANTAGIDCRIVPGDDMTGWAATLTRAARLAPVLARHRTRIVHAMAETCYRAAGVAGGWLGARRIVHFGFPPEPDALQWFLPVGPEALIGCYDGQAREVGALVHRFRPSCRAIGIPNGIDLARYSASQPPSARRVDEGKGPIVLTVGHLSEVKGHDVLLRAAAIVARSRPDCRFWLLGDETTEVGARARLEQMVVDLHLGDHVKFLGWRADVANMLHAATLVTLPSLNEGLPLAVLEAMACGKAVVATPVGGVPEAVEDGSTGALVPPGDADALASAISTLLGDPARLATWGRRAREVAEERFSLDRVVRRVESLYDELLRDGR
jgi:glycosyltransferase involved in cell wall biosynthesis